MELFLFSVSFLISYISFWCWRRTGPSPGQVISLSWAYLFGVWGERADCGEQRRLPFKRWHWAILCLHNKDITNIELLVQRCFRHLWRGNRKAFYARLLAKGVAMWASPPHSDNRKSNCCNAVRCRGGGRSPETRWFITLIPLKGWFISQQTQKLVRQTLLRREQ